MEVLHKLTQFCFSLSVLEGCAIMDNLSNFCLAFYMQDVHNIELFSCIHTQVLGGC